MNIDDLNYYNDHRTQGQAKIPTVHFYGCATCGTPGESCDCPEPADGEERVNGVHFYGTDLEEQLPVKWIVCPVCEGRGKHVNPSIDCGGISAREMHEDPDFAEQYYRGDFDQICNHCAGRTTVPGVDWDAMDEDLKTAYREQLREEAADRACYLAELRAGC